jgi:transposase-like protein
VSQREETKQRREYSPEFKLAAVKRVLAGEGTSALARELDIRRKWLYIWKDRFLLQGEAGLASRRAGRPRNDSRPRPDVAEPQPGRGELLAARKRIAELERKVGQQELELDFFGEALRRVKADTKRSAH